MKAGDVFENPSTGEYGYIRLGTEETNGELLIADLKIKVGGAVAGEHFHPVIRERFTVIQGRVGYKLAGKSKIAEAGDTLDFPPRIAHDWWNGGDEEARVIVQITPADRFEQMATTMFNLSKEGKTNSKGMPNLLQLAVIAKEYKDVIVFTNPPIWVQRIMFGILAPLGRLLGYKAVSSNMGRKIDSVKVEPLPAGIEIAGLRFHNKEKAVEVL